MALRDNKMFSVVRVVFIVILLVSSPSSLLTLMIATCQGLFLYTVAQPSIASEEIHRSGDFLENFDFRVPGGRGDGRGDDWAEASGQETSVWESNSTNGDLLSPAECEVRESLVCVDVDGDLLFTI